jgi:hypothetical protein
MEYKPSLLNQNSQGQRVSDYLKPSALPASGGRVQDRFSPSAQATTYQKTTTTIYFGGTQQGNPTRSKTGES